MTTPETTPSTTLDKPLKRGEQTITAVTLRKPDSGELRGVALADLLRMDVDALATVLPRITTPTLTKHEVHVLDPADLTDLGGKVAAFLLKKDMKPAGYQPE